MSGNGEGLVHGLQGGWMQLLPQHDGAMNYCRTTKPTVSDAGSGYLSKLLQRLDRVPLFMKLFEIPPFSCRCCSYVD